jgi:hypothetical protein
MDAMGGIRQAGRQGARMEATMAAAGSEDPGPFLLSRYPRAIETNKLDERRNVQQRTNQNLARAMVSM